MSVVRMKIEKIGSSDSVTYILVHFFVWNDLCTRAPMTVLRIPNGRVFLREGGEVSLLALERSFFSSCVLR